MLKFKGNLQTMGLTSPTLRYGVLLSSGIPYPLLLTISLASKSRSVPSPPETNTPHKHNRIRTPNNVASPETPS